MLEGKKLNLKIMEKEDLPLYLEWVNDPDFFGEYNPLEQMNKIGMERNYDCAPQTSMRSFI